MRLRLGFVGNAHWIFLAMRTGRCDNARRALRQCALGHRFAGRVCLLNHNKRFHTAGEATSLLDQGAKELDQGFGGL
jgi:hypothetical protein